MGIRHSKNSSLKITTTRIVREVHDDINQRLAMMAVEIEQLEANPSALQSRLQGLRTRISAKRYTTYEREPQNRL